MPNTREMRIEQVEDILAKWEFFYGQRAGRELWAEKPKDVQEKDIEAFNRDISFVRDFVRGVTIQKWIPVTERLPDGMDWVLCACKDGEARMLCYDYIMDDWDIYNRPNSWYAKGFVTHWMPLPQPPKEA